MKQVLSWARLKFQSPSHRGRRLQPLGAVGKYSQFKCFSPLLIGAGGCSEVQGAQGVCAVLRFSPLLIGAGGCSTISAAGMVAVVAFQSPSHRGRRLQHHHTGIGGARFPSFSPLLIGAGGCSWSTETAWKNGWVGFSPLLIGAGGCSSCGPAEPIGQPQQFQSPSHRGRRLQRNS